MKNLEKGTKIIWRQQEGYVIKDYKYMTLCQFGVERIGIPHGAFICGEARLVNDPNSRFLYNYNLENQ